MSDNSSFDAETSSINNSDEEISSTEVSSNEHASSEQSFNTSRSSHSETQSNQSVEEYSSSSDQDEDNETASDNEESSVTDREEIFTSDDCSENSGPDDPPYSFNSDTQSDSSESDSAPPDTSEQHQKNIVQNLLSTGYKGPHILKILRDEHGIQMSAKTLSRKRKEWGLRLCDLEQAPPPTPLSPKIRASLVSSHSKGMNLNEIQAQLANETSVNVSIRTIKRYLKQLNLKLLRNNVTHGKITIQQVHDAIHDARTRRLQSDAGYRRMRMILMREYDIQIPQRLVYDVLREIDPEGMAARLRGVCKRQIYQTNGPNHIWSSDGHDKLKRFGLTIYGFVDAWSRKILGMFVHVTNNNPRHIAVYFLQLASKAGGIPLLLTTDCGTETVKMARCMMELTYTHMEISLEDAAKRMHYTKSTHNQKIESLWSQMMKQHNRAIKHDILSHIEDGSYDDQDDVQK
ncbi:hypothetical protein PGT21_003430 [Puccinia graminis f. sp. tritici]|uniref:Integrase core domain-containing protein n=1 Tax=Puccinia graminis f. sp. tritici TaxID=56615 RepID=A0A5B0QEC4_PUCGR|nr:hypothetical protein PGT21_003430 [Puccinia graminis f. sp. tritici]